MYQSYWKQPTAQLLNAVLSAIFSYFPCVVSSLFIAAECVFSQVYERTSTPSTVGNVTCSWDVGFHHSFKYNLNLKNLASTIVLQVA